MGEINFLSSGGRGREEKKEKKAPAKNFEWTSPDAERQEKEKKSSSLFSFFKKQGGSATDEEKLKRSREIVLKTIEDKAPLEKNAKEKKVAVKPAVKAALNQPEEKQEGKNDKLPKIPEASVIEPARINLLNKILDFWRKYQKEKELKKNKEAVASDVGPEAAAEEKAADLQERPDKKEKKSKLPAKKNKPGENFLDSSDVLETNLMEAGTVSFIDWHKNSVVLAFYLITIIVIVGVIYGWMFAQEREFKARISEADKNIEELNAVLAGANKDIARFADLENKVKVLRVVLDGHVYWTNFFKFLEDNTIQDIYYLGFSGDNSGEYSLAGKAKNFHSISEQLRILKANDYVEDVGVSGGKFNSPKDGDSGGVDFNLQLSIKPQLFKK